MDLRRLRNFVTTAELLSFSKAAELQFISQPALSRQIAALELELGVRLFERGGRGVQLTAAGRIFVGEARQLLDGVDRALAAVRGVPAEHGTTIAVGFSADAAAFAVADLLNDLRATDPAVDLQIQSGDWDAQLEQVASGELDVAIGYLPQSLSANFEALPGWELEFGLLVSASHPAAGESKCSIREFSGDRIMIPIGEVGRAHRDRLVHYCVAAGFEPSIDERHSIAGIKVAVATERGVGFIPQSGSGGLPPNTALVTLSPPPPPCFVGVIWSASHRSPTVDRLLDLARPKTSQNPRATRSFVKPASEASFATA